MGMWVCVCVHVREAVEQRQGDPDQQIQNDQYWNTALYCLVSDGLKRLTSLTVFAPFNLKQVNKIYNSLLHETRTLEIHYRPPRKFGF
jgi:hypothetical protein